MSRVVALSVGAMALAWASGCGRTIYEPTSPLTHDFGDVLQGETVEHVFHVIHPGGAPRRVTGVKSSCSCTSVGILPTMLGPGGAKLGVQLRTAGAEGVIRRTIVMTIHDCPNVELTLHANVIRGCPAFCDFGSIPVGQAVRKVFPMGEWAARQGVRLRKFTHRSVEATLVRSGDSVDLVVELAGDLASGNFDFPLQFFFEARNAECTTMVRATVSDIVVAKPSRVFFAAPGREHRVEIYSTDGQSIELQRAQSRSTCFRVAQTERASPSRIALSVEFVGGDGDDISLDVLDVAVVVGGRTRSIKVPLFSVD